MFNIKPIVKEFELNGDFNISRYSRSRINVIHIEISKDNITGKGEAVPYKYIGEEICDLISQFNFNNIDLDFDIIDNLEISQSLKNGFVSAYLDWLAKSQNKNVWDIFNIDKPDNILTAYTLSLDSVDNMVKQACKNKDKPLLKLKLGDDNDIQRINAIRQNCPDNRIIVDANERWNNNNIIKLLDCCDYNNVEMVEQPLPKGKDNILKDINSSICICADESFYDINDIQDLIGKYDAVNIKLDKTGGLINALKAFDIAKQNNLKVVVGCMMGSSLAMAPATLVAQNADWVDLDGSLWVKEDSEKLVIKNASYIQTPESSLWG